MCHVSVAVLNYCNVSMFSLCHGVIIVALCQGAVAALCHGLIWSMVQCVVMCVCVAVVSLTPVVIVALWALCHRVVVSLVRCAQRDPSRRMGVGAADVDAVKVCVCAHALVT